MGDLTKNFSGREFECACCGRFVKNDKLLAALQAIRDAVGVPVHVTSGTRCAKHNKAVGGVADSGHLTGEAANIYADGMTKEGLGAAIKRLKPPHLRYCYLIEGSARAVHVDVDEKPRKAVFGF